MAGGGNAVDGTIAANAVQGTVAPETCGIGGDLFALVHRPGMDSPACLNSSGRAGSGADADALRKAGHTTMPLYGAPPVTVPGCVDGWYALSERYGSLPLSAVLRPAIRLAENGFAASRELSEAWTAHAAQLLTQASSPPMFPDGRPPEVGERISRPFLAESLQSVADSRDAFYLDRVGPAASRLLACPDRGVPFHGLGARPPPVRPGHRTGPGHARPGEAGRAQEADRSCRGRLVAPSGARDRRYRLHVRRGP